MRRADAFDVIGFDADDTLWKSEDGFREAEALFFDLVSPFTPNGVDKRVQRNILQRYRKPQG